MKISTLILLSITIILVLFTITTYVNYKQSEKVRENAGYLSVSSNIVRQSNQLLRNILNMERNIKSFLTTDKPYWLQNYDSIFVENQALLTDLSTSLNWNNFQSKKLGEINLHYKRLCNLFGLSISHRQNGQSNFNGKSDASISPLQTEEERIIRELQLQFRDLLNIEYSNRTEQQFILEQSERQTKTISFLFTALSLVVGIVIAILLAAYISRRISRLVKLANSISSGDYGVQVVDKSQDELSELTSSLNHMAAMLNENITLLESKNKELDQFAYIVSHDLKAPLRGIDNVISWIEEDHGHEIPDKVKEYLTLIRGRIKRSENLIQGILTYARIGKDTSDAEQVNVAQLVKEVVENVHIKPGLTINIDQTLPVFKTEKLPLTQIFSNLISNASKYHDKEKGMIKIYSKENSDKFLFFVEDDGPGIDPKYFEKIFAMFQTLHPRDSFESSGVGLAIVKKILDDAKEKITISSAPGKGSTFSFTWRKN